MVKLVRKPVKVARISFSSRTEENDLIQSPTEFQFIGSPDCQKWETIADFKTQFTTADQTKYWEIENDKRRAFFCVGIKVIKVTRGNYAAIQNLRMWMEPSQS